MYYINLLLFTIVVLLLCYISFTRQKNQVENYTMIYISVILGSLAIIFPIGVYYYFDFDVTHMGPTGDWLAGSSSPFLSFATFLILLATFKQQRKELDIAKKDSEDQRTTTAIQRFENTFFQMMNLHNEIIRSIQVVISNFKYPVYPAYENNGQDNYDREIFIGRNALENLYLNYKSEYEHNCNLHIDYRIEEIKETYENWYSDKEHHIGHYYRSLYHMYNLIHTSELDQKQYYAKLLRAQLSKSELLLLFYNSIAFSEDNKFIPLIREYNILKHINIDELICPEVDKVILDREYQQ